MFIIFGTSKCSYCNQSKELLNNHHLKYIYYDLNDLYSDWKQVFLDLPESLLNSQRSIPLIFNTDDNPEHNKINLSQYLPLDHDLYVKNFIGGYNTLQQMDLWISNVDFSDEY